MDSFSVYPLSQLLSPQQREEGEKKVLRFIWKSRRGIPFKKQTLKMYLFQVLHQEYGK